MDAEVQMVRPPRILFHALVVLAMTAACHARKPPPSSFPTEPTRSAHPRGIRPQLFPSTPQAPFTLTTGDGTSLRLEHMKARGLVDAPLAFTELHLTFRNPEPRNMEGRFSITLPPGASISRFAMKVWNTWQEGEVVERGKATGIYESYLHRKIDPALLEHSDGNRFTARVFPIFAHDSKEIILAYTQVLDLTDPVYTIPLLGLPQVDGVDIMITVHGEPGEPEQKSMVQQDHWIPDADFTLVPPPRRSVIVRDGTTILARVLPRTGAAPAPIQSLLILLDTSGSQARGFNRQLSMLRELVQALTKQAGPAFPLGVACFDQSVHLVFDGTSAEFSTEPILAHGAMGASNLHGVFSWLREHPRSTSGHPWQRVLLVSDGIATLGDTDHAELRTQVRHLTAQGVERMDAWTPGNVFDQGMLEDLVHAGLPHAGVFLVDETRLDRVTTGLLHAVPTGIRLSVDGASWMWPQTVEGLLPGDELLIYANVPPDKAVVVRGDGAEILVDAATRPPVQPLLLNRAWATAQIEDLLHQHANLQSDDVEARNALRQKIITLSIQHRIITPFTSMLVLESENEYARHKLNRDALGDILTMGESGLTVMERPATPSQELQPWPAPPGGPPPTERIYRKVTIIDFSDVTIEGELIDPEGSFLVHRRRYRHRDMVRIRSDFRHEMENAVGATPALLPTPPTSRFQDVMSLVATKKIAQALQNAQEWYVSEPENVLAVLALGEVLESTGRYDAAARAYGSLIDMEPARAEMRRAAAERWLRMPRGSAQAFAMDALDKAVAIRPDHLTGKRLLAYALVGAGRFHEAFQTLSTILMQPKRLLPRIGRERVIEADLGLIAAAWRKAEPHRAAEIEGLLQSANVPLETAPSLRFVLQWETDANNVDLHVRDGNGAGSLPYTGLLASGGRLEQDMQDGFGPECFTIRVEARQRSYPYHLKIHYREQRAAGLTMGVVQVIEHDGQGGLHVEYRPFILEKQGAWADLGMVGGPLPFQQ